MKKNNLTRGFLGLSGIIGIAIGGALLFFPVAFEASAGITLDHNISLLSEIRAYGGIILAGGIVIALGAFITNLMCLSITLSSLFYLSIGLSRLWGILVDGIPAEALVTATIAEIIIGLVSVYLMFSMKKLKHTTS